MHIHSLELQAMSEVDAASSTQASTQKSPSAVTNGNSSQNQDSVSVSPEDTWTSGADGTPLSKEQISANQAQRRHSVHAMEELRAALAAVDEVRITM